MIRAHQTAPTQFVEADGIRFAYRRFGKTGGVPLVFSQHYIGTMDYWDPTVTDGFAHARGTALGRWPSYNVRRSHPSPRVAQPLTCKARKAQSATISAGNPSPQQCDPRLIRDTVIRWLRNDSLRTTSAIGQ